MTCAIEVAGISIGLAGDGVATNDALAFACRHHQPSDRPADATISVVRRSFPRPTRRPDLEDDVAGVHAWWQDDRVVFDHRSGLVVEATRQGGLIGAEIEDVGGAVDYALPLVLGHLLAWRDRFILHGAAIAQAGKGLLALGPSGAGKSTLALVAMEAGWQVLTDDLVVLWPRDQELWVQGYPAPLALPGDLGSRLTIAAAPIPEADRGRVELTGATTIEPARLTKVAMVGHGAMDETAVEPLMGAAVLAALLEAGFFVGSRPLLGRFYPVASAVARLPARRFAHGRDPSRRVPTGVRAIRALGAGHPPPVT